ncbi:MAG: integrase, partial [Planctomycetes bacterium]|nr:integrase [Planctomycetota bacterium]
MPELMLRPLHFLLVWFATLQNRRLMQENDYLRTEVRALVLRFARENARWGYKRLMHAVGNLGLPIGRNTVANILKENGIEPAPERQTSWRQFLKSHAAAMVAMDFFTTEVWTWRGLSTIYTLFAIDHK